MDVELSEIFKKGEVKEKAVRMLNVLASTGG